MCVVLYFVSDLVFQESVKNKLDKLLRTRDNPCSLSSVQTSQFQVIQKAIPHRPMDAVDAEMGVDDENKIPAFIWDENVTEDQQEKAYIGYIRTHFKIPNTIKMIPNAKNHTYLNCDPEFLPFKLSGGIDVPFVLKTFAEHHNPKAGLVLQCEIKKPKTLASKSGSCFRQSYTEEIAAEVLSQQKVVTVLTDLVDHWQFFFSDGSSITTLLLKREPAVSTIQNLLKSYKKKEDDSVLGEYMSIYFHFRLL